MQLAAVSDLHINEYNRHLAQLLHAAEKNADVLLLCGDLTSSGKASEAQILADELKFFKIPVMAVLGNHDYENNRQKEISQILTQAGLIVLNGNSYVYKDVGFAGVKGFGGGFGPVILSSIGEKAIKAFVKESVNEELLLENALSSLYTDKKVVILHYAPITDTLEGESKEIYPFLGTSRLLSPLEEFQVTVVFHGHAHHGKLFGKTPANIPVYNVAMPVLKQHKIKEPYFILDI